MKVMQINTVCGTGSTGRIATDIYKVLEEQGHECIIAYGRGNAPDGIKTIKIGSNISVNIHGMLTRITDRHGFYSSLATKKFITQIREYNPDIIHLHNIHGYYLNIEILFNFLKEFNKPVVWTLHDCWAFTGHCSHFDYVGCEKWKTRCLNCPQKKEYPSSIMIDNSKYNFNKKKQLFTSLRNMTIVTPSIWLADLVKKSYLKEYPVKVINNGIDLDVFKPVESNFRELMDIKDKFIILGVANVWSERKGLKHFFELSNMLSSDEVIILVGLSEKQKENLPKAIIGITRTNNVTELTEIYSSANVLVNPTLEDNFPTTNLEALACGTPVITFKTGGSIESVDENCGLITKNKDIESLIFSIRTIKEYGKINYSKNCIERTKKYYNKVDRFMEYIDLYIKNGR